MAIAIRSRLFKGGRRSGDQAQDQLGVTTYSANPRGWDPEQRRVLDPLAHDDAFARHRSGQSYAALRRGANGIVVVAHSGSILKVNKLDPSGKVTVETREFHTLEGQLWLRSIKRRNGGDLPEDALVVDWFTWVRPGTTATWTRFDAESPQGRKHELRLDWDPDPHWYAHPHFGEYESLIEPDDLLERLWPGIEPLPLIDG